MKETEENQQKLFNKTEDANLLTGFGVTMERWEEMKSKYLVKGTTIPSVLEAISNDEEALTKQEVSVLMFELGADFGRWALTQQIQAQVEEAQLNMMGNIPKEQLN
jgi:hypothetical protein